MVKTIEQLLNGRYEYSVTPPRLTPQEICVTAEEGKDYRGAFLVESGDGQRLRGHGYVTNARIVLSRDRFTGREFRVEFGISARGLHAGDRIEGQIVLLLNAGEIIVPVCLVISGAELMSSAGEIRNLDDFTSLARMDRREAYRIFSGGRLLRVIPERETKIRTLYRASLTAPVTYQRMEEFLTAAGCKEAVRFTADKNSDSFEHLTESAQGFLRITKNTWGHVNLRAEAEGGFISLPQKHFVEDDFVGNTLDLTYIIHYEELNEGIQRGRITVDTDTGSLTLHITASKHTRESQEDRLLRKKALAGICRDYVSFRLGKTDGTAYMKRIVPRIASLRSYTGENLGLDLIEASAYYLVGAQKAASSILRKWESHDFGEEAAAFEASYLYLSYELGMSDLSWGELIGEIESLFMEDENSLIILTILSRISPEYRGKPGRCLTAMGRMYRAGNRSPYLYMEGALTLLGNERLMNTLSPFAVSILYFAVRYGVMDRDLALRTAVLSENEKSFSPLLFLILSESYRQFPLDEILEAVCRLILKGNPRNEIYHEWYERAIERDIRITRLYEYYMETLPDNGTKPYPVKVLRYFTMNNTLGSGRKAQFFANIIRNRSYDPETYDDYADQMSEFARKMLKKGSMSEDFAYVYSEFIPTLPTLEMAEAMARIMFRHEIVLDDPRVREVIVIHDALREEEVCPVYRGKAYIDLYTEDAVILFRDDKGRRYLSGIQYAVTRLIDYNTYIPIARRFQVRDKGFLLHLVTKTGDPGHGDEGTLQEFMAAAFSEEYTAAFREKIAGILLEYFASHRDHDAIDLFLSKIRTEQIGKGSHTLLIEVMMLRGMDREAFETACRYGYEDLDDHLLGRLAGRMIEKRDYEYDEELMLAAAEAFRRGVRDKRIIIYLCSYFEGPLQEMCDVRREAAALSQSTRIIDEKILQLAMLTRVSIPDGPAILHGYSEKGGSGRIIEAYIQFEALRSFMENTPLDERVAAAIEKRYDEGGPEQALTTLSLLRYYAGQNFLTEEETEREEKIFKEAVGEGYLFAFFSRLPLPLRQKYLMDDKMIIECRALPQDKVILRVNAGGEGETADYPMRRMTGGIFARAFTMFAGEVLRYRTVIIRGGETITGAEEACVMTAGDAGGKSRYQRINRMIAEKKEGNIGSFRETQRKYDLAMHAVSELFPIRKNENGEAL